jgi:DNA polymerase-3 subunit beta
LNFGPDEIDFSVARPTSPPADLPGRSDVKHCAERIFSFSAPFAHRPHTDAMKFTASSAELLEALNTVNRAVPSKSTMPILECILFEREGDTLRLSATDLEISIVQTVSVQFETNGTPENTPIAVPAQRLLDTLRALPDLPIEFSADSDFEIRMETAQGHYKMVGYD